MDKVLIIQDSPSINMMLESRLESGGFSVDAVETGEEGIKKAKGCNYQLILLDLKLPGMDGLEVSQILREEENTKNIPIVLMSAQDEPELSRSVAVAGADGYIALPFEGKEFVQKIKGFIRKS